MPIEDRVLAMYAKGQSQRDITSTIQDIYGFNISPETISKITERIVPLVQEFRNRALKKFYPFIFVDAMYTPVKTEAGAGQKALYNMIGVDVEGHKDVLGFWLSEDESSRHGFRFWKKSNDAAWKTSCSFPSMDCRGLKMPSKPSIRKQPRSAASSI